jgi:hypothetical protein
MSSNGGAPVFITLPITHLLPLNDTAKNVNTDLQKQEEKNRKLVVNASLQETIASCKWIDDMHSEMVGVKLGLAIFVIRSLHSVANEVSRPRFS